MIVEDQPLLGQRQLQPVGAAAVVIDRREAVLLDQVEDRDRALMLDIGRRAADRFVELDVDQPGAVRSRSDMAAYMFSRIATERAMRVEPFGLGQAIAAGASARNCSGPSLRIEVRFMKSSTDRPDEKRAERAVGSTWLEPPT